jgi:hypothetical protein
LGLGVALARRPAAERAAEAHPTLQEAPA